MASIFRKIEVQILLQMIGVILPLILAGVQAVLNNEISYVLFLVFGIILALIFIWDVREYRDLLTKLRNEKVKLKEMESALKIEKKEYVWTDLHKLNDFAIEYNELNDLTGNFSLILLAQELSINDPPAARWSNFIMRYQQHYLRAVGIQNQIVKTMDNDYYDKKNFIELMMALDVEISNGYHIISDIFYSIENMKDKKMDEYKRRFNVFCESYNPFIIDYNRFIKSMKRKYKPGMSEHPRLRKICTEEVLI